MLMLSACTKQEDATSSRLSEPALTKQYRQQSATVIVSLSETNLTTAGQTRLMIDVQAPAATSITFPEIQKLVKPFILIDRYTEPEQRLSNGKTLTRQVWTLAPNLPGDTLFPTFSIIVGNHEIQTEPISLHVRSVLPQGLDTFEIKDIAEPIAQLPEQAKWEKVGLLGGAILIVLLTLLQLIRLRRRPRIEPMIPPHKIALERLSDLIEQDPEPTAFLHELNHLLREYIERRFFLPALEKTPKELIPILEKHDLMGLTPKLTPKLMEFIEQAETYRFAHTVPAEFIGTAIEFVRTFIEATKEESPCV